MIIEVVDTTGKVDTFLSFVEQHIPSGILATMENVQVRFYRGRRP